MLTLIVYIVFNVVDALASGPAGALSDKIGRRRTILIGYSLFTLVCAGFVLISLFETGHKEAFVILVILFALYGLFKAFIDAAQRAFVSDLSQDEIRATALGTFETFTGLAAIPSGLIAGVLWNMNPMATFGFGFVLSLFSVLSLITILKNR